MLPMLIIILIKISKRAVNSISREYRYVYISFLAFSTVNSIPLRFAGFGSLFGMCGTTNYSDRILSDGLYR